MRRAVGLMWVVPTRASGARRRQRPRTVTMCLLAVTAVGLCWIGGSGCSDPCCTTDGLPITLEPPPGDGSHGLVASFRYPAATGGESLRMSIDTGTALTFVRRQSEPNQVVLRDFDLLDGAASGEIVRAQLRGIEVLPQPLEPAPSGPDAILGGHFLRNFSVEIDFAKPSLTLWPRQAASDGFLGAAGFAVMRFNVAGGGEITAESRPDFFGLTGPVEVPSTRVVLRACAVPDVFDPATAPEALCCKRGDEVGLATGTNLALVVATGVGPVVLSQSAWERIAAVQAVPLPTLAAGPPLSIPALGQPLTDVLWSTLPRVALVDQELDDSMNPGACVELARSRRLEWIEHHQSSDSTTGACVLPCDTDPREAGKAQNSAAYLEVAGTIAVAVVPDRTPFLQGLRAEIRPEGPEIDGLAGADLFAQTTMELDYRSQPARAVIACPTAARASCYVAPRCPRLTEPTDVRACFGQPRRSLPVTCDVSVCG